MKEYTVTNKIIAAALAVFVLCAMLFIAPIKIRADEVSGSPDTAETTDTQDAAETADSPDTEQTVITPVAVGTSDGSGEAVTTDSSDTAETAGDSASDTGLAETADDSASDTGMAEAWESMIESTDVVQGSVFVEDVCVSGMTLQEVQQVIDDKFSGFAAEQIVINVRDIPVSVPTSAFGLYYSNSDLASYILKLQGRGNIWQRYKMDRYVADNGGLEFALDLEVDEENVRDILVNQCSTLDIPRVDMRVERGEDGSFYATEMVNGIYTDVDTTTANICHYLDEEWHGGQGMINAALVEDPAIGDPEAVSRMDSILGSGVTSFQVDEKNQYRNTNIAVATSKLNGSIVYPGEEFSTITPMMPFTEEEGYVHAPAYEQGEVVDDIGGGICQVSTTLYRAVLEAELEVVERNQHSMIVGYVDPSMDATISEGEKDFRFINNTDAPIYIEGFIEDNTVHFNIYGHETRPAERSIGFESEVTNRVPYQIVFALDPTLEFGSIRYTDGHDEVDATAYKLVYENGELVSREPLTNSNYQLGNATCYVGTMGASEEQIASLADAVASQNQETVNEAVLNAGGALKVVP